MLARIDETELLVPLHDGVHEFSRWATFLARLRGRTRSREAYLHLGETGQGSGARAFAARPDHDARARRLDDLRALGPLRHEPLRPGRVYDIEEILGGHARRRAVPFARAMRIAEPGISDAVLIIVRDDRDYDAADAALLGRLAPHLGVALRTFATLERAALRERTADHCLARAGHGWFLLDGKARVVEADERADAILRRAGPPHRHRDLAQAAAWFARHPAAAPRLLRLDDDAATAVLAAPASDRRAAGGAPAFLGLVRAADRAPGPDRPLLLAAALGLTPGEGRVADALARGRGIADAAADFGLTVETARYYTKQIYAKTGARGQADLVRLALRTVAALA